MRAYALIGKLTPAQRRNLLILRDEILPGIEEGELNMERIFNACGTPSCLLGHAIASGRFPELKRLNGVTTGDSTAFGLYGWEWMHIFRYDLPNDPTWLAANITDLLESET